MFPTSSPTCRRSCSPLPLLAASFPPPSHRSGGYIPGLAPAVVGCCLYAILGFLAVLRESSSRHEERVHSTDNSCVFADLVRHGQNWMLPLIIGLFGRFLFSARLFLETDRFSYPLLQPSPAVLLLERPTIPHPTSSVPSSPSRSFFSPAPASSWRRVISVWTSSRSTFGSKNAFCFLPNGLSESCAFPHPRPSTAARTI